MMYAVPTCQATIYVGLKEGYGGVLHAPEEAVKVCEDYCNDVGLGLTVWLCSFVYTGGDEPGVCVGIINYPRFPSSKDDIRRHALVLAGRLKETFRQERLTVVFSDETIMLGEK